MRAQTGELEETTEAVMVDIQLLGESVSKVIKLLLTHNIYIFFIIVLFKQGFL